MIRKMSVLAALTVAVAAVGFSLPVAQAKSVTYQAVPVVAIEGERDLSVGDTLWECNAGGCTTTSGSGSAATVCSQAAKKFGKLQSFNVNAAAFEAEKLAKCNEKAAS
ncbi:hypothetical protein sos41_28640 [Alphaproteobacteria bacterium SO-S41]|nr:hypothetical protein sos41_28640 [Alphaproteobacteria bacterium SO-S41]